MKTVGLVLLAAFLAGAAALGILTWVRTLGQVSREEQDPAERRKWWLRVFFLRLAGILWYEYHRKQRR